MRSCELARSLTVRFCIPHTEARYPLPGAICEGPAGMEVPFMDLGWFSGMSVRVLCTGGDIKTVKSRLSEKDIVD
ncbi:hypothetical protein M011DRAFT_468773 [Sporormia fimetaria CBS 119925]|uniref:Uncharacterized protein n=1 Tax=Sporormia fimetaria CBS 119925 TaxID=1340428 RepID=A0A6A6VAJ9_9PLEO|nr:hypothetical protein M011DRAFT_468773 [Sporormia fimetaria CBS 119925]